jgi:glycosyltransferase involved in cell wall biosynthesis
LSSIYNETMFNVYHAGNPCVSVIMPTYNRADYLQRSISSYINQVYKDSELIVVDDGSEDDTFVIVHKFMQAHDNIRYIKHSHRKLSLSKNAGIRAATGKFIAFLDSDDEYKPDYLQKRVELMEADQGIDLVQGQAIIIGDQYVKDRNNPSRKIHLSECHIGPTFFGKTELFIALGGFDKNITYSEDSLFWEKAALHYKTKKFDHPGYIYYRDTPGSICNSI